ncbi:MAG: SpoIIE family protein phosphatase [Pseudomonadales bacterium]|nr:SpoIIE family protein phosphatase [Pseudomonadales bacterium]
MGTIAALFNNESEIVDAALRQSRSNVLAGELRQSSDDLTKMARLFAATGEPRYRQYFEEILAIRNGQAPRPERYDLVYWDLVGTDGVRPRPFESKVAMSDRMANEGFTIAEFSSLQYAQDLSDSLTRLEVIAMNAVEGRFDNGTGRFLKQGPPDLEMARGLLFGAEYMSHKKLIMTPISEFLVMVEERTATEVSAYADLRGTYAATALVLSLLVAIVTAMTFVILRRRVITPLELAVASADLIAVGEAQVIDYRARDEMGSFIQAFNGMVLRVSEMMGELQSDNIRLSAEIDISGKLQQMLLPTKDELRQVPGLDIACHMQPASEVGGDYYDVLHYNGRTKIGIGDVTGHGLESGVMAIMTQCVIRALLLHGEQNPVHFLDTLNRTLYSNVQRLGWDKNLTLCLLDYANGELKLSGQHESMLVVRADGELELVDTIDLGFPIALEHNISSFIDHTTVQLSSGDGVVLYTDGITEAENAMKEQYGMQRLCEIVQKHWAKSADEIKKAVVLDVSRFIGDHTLYDDITLIVAKQR